MVSPIKVLTWHVHGSYLYYLSQVPCEFYLPVTRERRGHYIGKTHNYDWPENVKEVAIEDLPQTQLDCILFQARDNYERDQYEILTKEQQNLPRLYLEHDPPREHPTDTRHVVSDKNTLVVHVTNFNQLMWDNAESPTRVIEHGVMVPQDARYSGAKAMGVTVVNNMRLRGRRLGADLFLSARKRYPIDLVGMNAEELGGLGEVDHRELPHFLSEYRFFYNPIRYTSLGLAICEAMMLGLPVVGFATAELANVIESGRSGFISTRESDLFDVMSELLISRSLAEDWGRRGQELARERFHIERFKQDWLNTLGEVTGKPVIREAAS